MSRLDEYLKELINNINATCDNARSAFNLLMGISLFLGAFTLGIDDMALFLDSKPVMPYLDIQLKVSSVFLLGPILYILVYCFLINKLFYIRELFEKYQQEKCTDDKSQYNNLLKPFFYLDYLKNRSGLEKLLSLSLTYFIPTTLLAFIMLKFLPYQSIGISAVHLIIVLIIPLCNYFYLKQLKSSWQRIINIRAIWDYFKNIRKGKALHKITTFMEYSLDFLYTAGFITIPLLSVYCGILLVLFIKMDLTQEGMQFDKSVWYIPRLHLENLHHKDLIDQPASPEIINAVLMKCEDNCDALIKEASEKYSKGLLLRNRSFIGINLDSSNLYNIDLEKSDLRGSSLSNTNLSGSNLSFANFNYSNSLNSVYQAFLIIRNSNLYNTKFNYVKFQRLDLTQSKLISTKFNFALLSSLNLKKAKLNSMSIFGAGINSIQGYPNRLTWGGHSRINYNSKPILNFRETDISDDIKKMMRYLNINKIDICNSKIFIEKEELLHIMSKDNFLHLENRQRVTKTRTYVSHEKNNPNTHVENFKRLNFVMYNVSSLCNNYDTSKSINKKVLPLPHSPTGKAKPRPPSS